MRILVTGQTSPQIQRETKKMGLTVAGAISQALEARGHTVDVRPYTLKESLSGDEERYDHAIVGLGPLKGIGTAYCYGALKCIYDYGIRDDRRDLTLFIDDTDTKKIGTEHRTITRKPHELVKPFFQYKREYETARERSVLDYLLTAVHALTGETAWDHAPVFMPTWARDLGFAACLNISRAAADAAVMFDPTPYFGHDVKRVVSAHERPYWSTNWRPDSPAINKMGVNKWDVLHNSRLSWNVLGGAHGVLIPSAAWAPELGIASAIGIPTAGDWRTLGPALGASFEELPMNIEIMSDKERKDLAQEQRNVIESKGEALGDCEEIINATVERMTR